MTFPTQDVFGASPKTVLNKPMMHVQHQEPNGVQAGNSVAGDNDRVLNTVLSNSISGASLAANEITLPAGEYYIECTQAVYSTNVGYTQKGNAKIMTSTGTLLLRGANVRWREPGTQLACPVTGKITLAAATAIKAVTYVDTGDTAGLGTEVSDDTEVYVDLRIWKLDENVEQIVINDPAITFDKPMMHVQDVEPENTILASIVGQNQIPLNTLASNSIPGASFAGPLITLPAGTYYIEAQSGHNRSSTNSVGMGSYLTLRKNSDDTVLARGPYWSSYNRYKRITGSMFGKFTLTETTDVKLMMFCEVADTAGIFGSGPLDGSDLIMSDVRIWQLDAVAKQPVIVNDKLFPLPGNVIVTGNMHGLEYELTTTSTITVQPGICMDSTNENVLTLTNPQLVTIPSTLNTVFNLFLTDDGQLVKTDTDVDGANLPAQDKRRWIGFVSVGDDGNIRPFIMNGDRQEFLRSSQALIGSVVGTTYTAINHANQVPVGRIKSIRYGIHFPSATGAPYIYTQLNGYNGLPLGRSTTQTNPVTNEGTSSPWLYQGANTTIGPDMPFDPNRKFKSSTGTAGVLCHIVTMKR